ncbi:type II toxin-antitoxin system HipA family toxin [Nocardia shimofusensis]|uniref:type II toxin-antitoxin system HipA family toxin n=1 Tax=Nocardia shimofusensis TaxID=228596 RepID=UPI00082E4691|nr:type II toxin-antitoxin system HipA family toxin [Nocardia shimofusensis]
MRDIAEADVYKSGRFAGTLRRERDDIVFRYAEAYRADTDAPQVAFTLPKRNGIFRSTGGSVPAFFAGLLPEGARLAVIENFFLDMAAACGIRVPDHRLATDRNGQTALFVERFDRVPGPGGVRRLAQEDACQVLDRYPASKYRISLQEAIIGLAEAVQAGAGSRRSAVLHMLEIAAFSYLIGNGDLHGKNLSIRQAPGGIWEVTPAYDLLTTQPYLSWKDPMALSLFGRNNKLHRRWWLEAAERLGVPARACDRSLNRIIEAAEPWIDRVIEIGFEEEWSKRLAALIAERRDHLRQPS